MVNTGYWFHWAGGTDPGPAPWCHSLIKVQREVDLEHRHFEDELVSFSLIFLLFLEVLICSDFHTYPLRGSWIKPVFIDLILFITHWSQQPRAILILSATILYLALLDCFISYASKRTSHHILSVVMAHWLSLLPHILYVKAKQNPVFSLHITSLVS